MVEPESTETHKPNRRPVYRYTTNRIDEKHTAHSLSILASNLVGGLWRLAATVLCVLGICTFAYHWYTSTNVGHNNPGGTAGSSSTVGNNISTSTLQNVSCQEWLNDNNSEQEQLLSVMQPTYMNYNHNISLTYSKLANTCNLNPEGTLYLVSIGGE